MKYVEPLIYALFSLIAVLACAWSAHVVYPMVHAFTLRDAGFIYVCACGFGGLLFLIIAAANVDTFVRRFKRDHPDRD